MARGYCRFWLLMVIILGVAAREAKMAAQPVNEFKAPVRLVKSAGDIETWLNSEVSHVQREELRGSLESTLVLSKCNLPILLMEVHVETITILRVPRRMLSSPGSLGRCVMQWRGRS